MQQQQQSTNKSCIVRTHSINMLTAGMASDQWSGQASSSTNFAGVQANSQADPQVISQEDPQAVSAKRLGMTPNEICIGGDVFSLGEPPAESSRKEVIQEFVTSS